jgi:hypothetical protein
MNRLPVSPCWPCPSWCSPEHPARSCAGLSRRHGLQPAAYGQTSQSDYARVIRWIPCSTATPHRLHAALLRASHLRQRRQRRLPNGDYRRATATTDQYGNLPSQFRAPRPAARWPRDRGIVGAAVGSQIGGGSARYATSAIGSVVGGMAGRQIYEQSKPARTGRRGARVATRLLRATAITPRASKPSKPRVRRHLRIRRPHLHDRERTSPGRPDPRPRRRAARVGVARCGEWRGQGWPLRLYVSRRSGPVDRPAHHVADLAA